MSLFALVSSLLWMSVLLAPRASVVAVSRLIAPLFPLLWLPLAVLPFEFVLSLLFGMLALLFGVLALLLLLFVWSLAD
jgi:hypothetical protein